MERPEDALDARLKEPGPKRLLALDGGGIRGLISLGFLGQIEGLLRRQHGRPDMVLSDYFDLVGGTSTGAIIATLVAMGWSVDDIRRTYFQMAEDAFRPRMSWLGPVARLLGAKFDEKPLSKLLQRVTADHVLGSDALRTGLMITTKRADTASTWVLLNVPGHRFYEQNKDLKLWEILRASTAAPTYFRPQVLSDVGDGQQGVFVDGGVTMHNDPALQLLMTATLEGFGLAWPKGEDKLLLCSIGTGAIANTVDAKDLKKFGNLQWLALLLVQMMGDAAELNRTMLQWASSSPTAQSIDAQIGTLGEDDLGSHPLLAYLRYDVSLEEAALAALDIKADIGDIQAMDNVGAIKALTAIGEAAASAQVSEGHFPGRFSRAH